MKKSIKYAGIAAATLLTVAPIAAPVVSNSTTVAQAAVGTAGNYTVNYTNNGKVVDTQTVARSADDTKITAADLTAPDGYTLDPTFKSVDLPATGNSVDVPVVSTDTDATQVKNQAKDFHAQFNDIDSSNAVTTALKAMTGDKNSAAATASYFGSKNAGNIQDVQDNANVQALMDSPKANYIFNKLTDANTTVYFTATDNKGKDYNGTSVGQRPTDLANAMALDSKMPVTITVHLNSDALNSILEKDQTFTFDINKTSDNELKSIDAKYTTPIEVAKKSKTAATQLVDTDSVVLNDQDGESTAVSNITFGDNFYSKYSDAVNGVNPVGAPDIDGGEFKTAGTYYQTVTYTAKDNSALAAFLTKYANDNTVDSDYSIYVNGKKASAGYDYTANDQDIKFVRAIKVSDNESEWTTTDTTGVVTTKTNHEFYTLKNDAGNDVTNRALAKNTAWKTNAVRTDQNGNKQYRVGASEWIDANDVTFSDKATDNNGEGAYTDVKALNGKVTTAGPEGFYYPLYDDNGKMVTNRGVSGLSAWYTDKSAVNANGDTVYHVATGEWLQGNNVTYTAY